MKRVLSFIFALMLITSSVFAVSFTANAQEATKYIYISSAADFAKIAKNPKADFFVTDDIDFTGITDYKAAKSFSGTINGNGHTVKNFSGDHLFAASNSGIIKNFVIENATCKQGIACNDNWCVVENIVMNNCKATLVSENCYDYEFVGPDYGIIRYCVTNNCTQPMCGYNCGRMIGCINNSDITREGGAAGIAYCGDGGDYFECINNGNITSTGADSDAGGIFCSEVYGGAYVVRCTNNGNVSAVNTASGIGNDDCIIAYDCINNGNISGKKAYGISSRGGIKKCVNTGTVTGTDASYAIANDNMLDIYPDRYYISDEGKTYYNVENCYYLEGTGAPSGHNGDTAVADMSDKSVFPALDFDKKWQIKDTLSLQCTNTKTIGIAVKSLPNKTTNYHPDYDWFDGELRKGMEIVAFDNKGNQLLADYYSLSGCRFSGEGLHRITVLYDCFTADFNLSTAKFPKQVTNLKAKTVTKTSVTLTWKKVSDAKRYNVQQYNAKTKKWKTVKTVKKNTAKITNLKKSKSYKFRVRAEKKVRDYCDCYGEYSKSVTVKTKK